MAKQEARGFAESLERVPVATGQLNVEARFSVHGHRNHVQVAGRDLVTTARHVQRTVITPNARHIDPTKRKKIRSLLAAVADRLAGEDGKPNFGAAHSMLQRRFNIVSYLLLPHEQCDEAVTYLKQQRSIYRSRLRFRNPATHQADLLRIIHTSRVALGWDRARVLQFAAESLRLRSRICSLRELGPLQLQNLSRLMQRAMRERAPSS